MRLLLHDEDVLSLSGADADDYSKCVCVLTFALCNDRACQCVYCWSVDSQDSLRPAGAAWLHLRTRLTLPNAASIPFT